MQSFFVTIPRVLGSLPFFALLCMVLGCTGSKPIAEKITTDDGKTLEAVQLALNWFPEAEHGGFYAAQVHGYFEEEGLQVEILPGGPNAPVLQRVANRELAFGLANADRILLARGQQADLVALMVPIQMSPRCIMLHKESGITSFEQIRDLTLSMETGPAFAQFIQQNCDLENVKIVPYSGSVAPFLSQKKYAQQAYVFSEPFIAKEEGAETTNLMVSDLGFNPYASVLITHSDMIAKRPDLVEKVTRASVRGWQHYLQAPEKTNALIEKLNPEMDQEILEYGVKSLKPLCMPEPVGLKEVGTMSKERWETLIAQLEQLELLKPGVVETDHCFTTNFLEDIPSVDLGKADSEAPSKSPADQ
ncbi:Hydroxymethylpyrimidine ABC transporter, substrate-binding component [Planctomycetales bacterium 10988]|nr:Hydroxymethylpyrimidine ABC transporter, substrate-binding component [Planctomycetales bacterium 10988]